MTAVFGDQLQRALGDSYIVERELGGGGMSRVYLAVERRFARRVVIKVLSPELAEGLSSERFEREIGLAAGLQQANIVPVITAGDVDGLPWYTMPFVEGESLRARLQKGPVPPTEATAILKDVARALAYAHERGIVHRDIKPENILLSGDAAVVTDFGIAKAVTASKTHAPGGTLTQVGMSLGTPAYIAPEQAVGGDVDGRADIYAWGVIAYELLAGRHPFADKVTPQQLIAAHIAELPAPLTPSTPTARLVMRAIAKNPDERPSSAREIIDALGVATTAPLTQVRQTKRRTVIAATMLVVAVVVAGAYLLSDDRRKPEATSSAITTLAVLPFVNTSGNAQDEYFSDGMTDELARALAEIPGLRLAGRTSSYAYKGKTVEAREIGRALDVDGIVEGTVRRSGDRLRVTAALTSTVDGKQRWSKSYESTEKDVFAVQDTLTASIVAALTPELSGQSKTKLAEVSRGTNDAVAYDHYLLGQHFWAKRGALNLYRAVDEYRRAIARDPEFARAFAALAMTYSVLPGWVADSADASTAAAVTAAQQALALDSTLSDARLALAQARFGMLRHSAAESLFVGVVRQEPLNPTARHWRSANLITLGRFEEAIAEGLQASAIEPLSAVISANMAYAYSTAGRMDDGVRALQRTFTLDAAYVDPPVVVPYLFAGKADSALVHLQQMRRADSTALATGGMLAFAFAASGHWVQYDSLRREAQRVSRSTHLMDAAIIALAGGEREPMVRYLSTIEGQRKWIAVFYTLCAPLLMPLRNDPRVAALAGKSCPAVTWPILPRPLDRRER